MPNKWADLRAKMSPESRARAEARSRKMLAGMTLKELRQAVELSQRAVADRMGTSRSSISRIERSSDSRVSTLRRYVEALGAELQIVARFPEGKVVITQLEDGDR